MSSEHIHQNLDEEIRSIGGYYQILEEGTLPFRDREVLYVVEIGHVETSCCGAGGIPFILVPGYVVSWHCRQKSGCAVTEVERISDVAERREISRLLMEKYPNFTQVSFA